MMTPIPKPMLRAMLDNPLYDFCFRAGEDCDGRLTFEHAFKYEGRKLNEIWAILRLCAFHHSVDQFQDGRGLNKEINHWIALCRATPEDLAKYPRAGFEQEKIYLVGKYGIWTPPMESVILWGNHGENAEEKLGTLMGTLLS